MRPRGESEIGAAPRLRDAPIEPIQEIESAIVAAEPAAGAETEMPVISRDREPALEPTRVREVVRAPERAEPAVAAPPKPIVPVETATRAEPEPAPAVAEPAAPTPEPVPEPATASVAEPAVPEAPTPPDESSSTRAAESSTPEPEARPEPEAKPEPQVAALDIEGVPNAAGESMQLPFDVGSADLQPGAGPALTGIAALLEQDKDLRVQLKAYAGGDAETASQARRLSLSRALSVRSFFIEQGVRSTRIDVRALGNRVEDGPSDRVDIFVIKR
jgi:outer membrane protein OmpA-like peptidoglycan-associated protein